MKGSEAEACEATMKACIPKVTKLVVVDDDGENIEFLNLSKIVFSLQDDCRTLKIFTDKAPRKRSDIAKDLHTPKYRQRVKPGKKPKGPSLEEMLDEAEES